MSYLLIGLGNPGEKYQGTRHNAGKEFVGWIKQVQESTKKYKNVQEGELEAVETECFMNESGRWVKRWLEKRRLLVIGYWSRIKVEGQGEVTLPKSQHLNQQQTTNNQQSVLFIAHDDLDIPLGKFKIQFGKGPRLHNGVLSVEQALGTKEFWRVRIGIEGRRTKDEGRRTSGEGYVLEKFTAAEKKILEMVFPEIRDRLSSLSFLRKQESIPDQVRDKF